MRLIQGTLLAVAFCTAIALPILLASGRVFSSLSSPAFSPLVLPMYNSRGLYVYFWFACCCLSCLRIARHHIMAESSVRTGKSIKRNFDDNLSLVATSSSSSSSPLPSELLLLYVLRSLRIQPLSLSLSPPLAQHSQWSV